MGILTPINLLYALSLAALVVIYLRARSRPVLEVSSLMLFEELDAAASSRSLVKVDILFWIELATLAALTMALCGFYLLLPPRAGHTRRSALVFDVAAGMGARQGSRTRLDSAKEQALNLISRAQPDEQFTVVAYASDAEVRLPATSDLAAVRGAIGALRPLAIGSRPAALMAALMRARDADQTELFADRIPPGIVAGGGIDLKRVRYHHVGDAAPNLAIVSLEPGIAGFTQGHCAVRNFSAEPRMCELAIDSDGHPVQH